MKYFNVYAYTDVKLDNTGSVIEPELPDGVDQYVDTGDGIVEKIVMREIEQMKKDDNTIIIKMNTKGDVTTFKLFMICD